MRLVAWNCFDKFERNFAALDDLKFDLAVVCECDTLPPDVLHRARVTPLVKRVHANKAFGVFARSPWAVELLPHQLPWLLPVKVRGPMEFTLLALWALDPRAHGSYPSQTARVIRDVVPNLKGATVLAGDLNAPIASTASAHARNVAALSKLGLISAHHTDEPTFFRRGKGFCIDHIFTPREWNVSLQVGGPPNWAGRSDHLPLIADVRS